MHRQFLIIALEMAIGTSVSTLAANGRLKTELSLMSVFIEKVFSRAGSRINDFSEGHATAFCTSKYRYQIGISSGHNSIALIGEQPTDDRPVPRKTSAA